MAITFPVPMSMAKPIKLTLGGKVMQIPGFYPEPNNAVLSAGYAFLGSNTGIYAEEAALRELPGLTCMAQDCLPAAVSAPDEVCAKIIVRMLTDEDLRYARKFFKREYTPEEIENDVFFLNITDEGIIVSALNAHGFFYAFQTLKRLVSFSESRRTVKIRKGVVFDYAHMKIRAVSIKSAAVPNVDRLLTVMSRLRYNSLIIEDLSAGTCESSVLCELREACSRHFVNLLPGDTDDMRLICGLDGPSFLDWEHKSRRDADGAAVSLGCGTDAGQLAGSGFLFNLAYSAYMLWNSDYDNFSWEKVNDLAISCMHSLMDILDGNVKSGTGIFDLAAYPLTLLQGMVKHQSKPQLEVASGKSSIVAKAGERAESLIFRHTIESRDPAEEDADGILGCYTVDYRDGTSLEIPLKENHSIGRSDIWTGRRYNAWKHAYDTDKRLKVLSCYTGLVKRVSANGKLKVLFDYKWVNPYPEKVVESISLTVYPAEPAYTIAVYGIDIETRLTAATNADSKKYSEEGGLKNEKL